jgi:hypothetical protein
MLLGMRPPCDQTGFMTAPRPQGWVRFGESLGLWWNGRQIANVQPGANGITVILSCRKLWQDKRVSAASVSQGKRYVERWCAARILEDVPLRQAVQHLTAKPEERVLPKRSATQLQQERRLSEALKLPGEG